MFLNADPHVTFTAAEYLVTEDEEFVTVCVEVSSLVFSEVAITVIVTTEDDSATSMYTHSCVMSDTW